MRGHPEQEPSFISLINVEQLIARDHPIRRIKQTVDEVLAALTRMQYEPDSVPADRRDKTFRKLYGVIDQTISRIYFALDVRANQNIVHTLPRSQVALGNVSCAPRNSISR